MESFQTYATRQSKMVDGLHKKGKNLKMKIQGSLNEFGTKICQNDA